MSSVNQPGGNPALASRTELPGRPAQPEEQPNRSGTGSGLSRRPAAALAAMEATRCSQSEERGPAMLTSLAGR